MLLLLSNMWNSDIQMKDPSNVMYAVTRKLWVTDIKLLLITIHLIKKKSLSFLHSMANNFYQVQ